MIKILAVDDEERILKLIRNALEKEGYEVDAVNDPLRIRKMRLQDYKLILLDVMMPGMDGFTLCEEIRDLADCPILFLTAKTEEKDIMRGLGIGGEALRHRRAPRAGRRTSAEGDEREEAGGLGERGAVLP